jgi:hypothetical protein
MARRAKHQTPWWLEQGTESCSNCNHTYAHRTEVFCFDCDGPVCAVCVQQTVTLELVCPSCLTNRDTGGDTEGEVA